MDIFGQNGTLMYTHGCHYLILGEVIQMSEMIVKFHHDERGIARSWDEVGKLVRCKDCVHCADDWNGNQPMFTCELGIYGGSVDPYYFCS